ncbi:hypothetical protein [Jiella sp. M17.18]|uniref:hypothetical protein n=1 Tax=Jiella sp. M17.18 TaxID=3234247 RepID=UPI0034DF03D4
MISEIYGNIASLSTENWISLISGFGGAALGAIIGGASSLLLALLANRASQKTIAKQQKKNEQAIATQTVLKTIQVVNGIYTIRSEIDESIPKDHGGNIHRDDYWKFVLSRSGFGLGIPVFDASDFAPFLSKKAGDLAMRIMLLQQRYQSADAGFQEYSKKRSALQEIIEDYTVFDQRSGQHVTSVPPQLERRFAVRSQEINGLILQIYDDSGKSLEDGKKILSEAVAYCRDRYGENSFSVKIADAHQL